MFIDKYMHIYKHLVTYYLSIYFKGTGGFLSYGRDIQNHRMLKVQVYFPPFKIKKLKAGRVEWRDDGLGKRQNAT